MQQTFPEADDWCARIAMHRDRAKEHQDSDERTVLDRVRYAARLADPLRTKWTALSIENRSPSQLRDTERGRIIEECLHLAQQLGGEAATVPGRRGSRNSRICAREQF